MSLRHRLGQRGDTLVEVAIALAILSFVLTSAFVTAHRAYVVGQTAKERSLMVTLAQQQAEALQSFRDSHAWNNFVYGSDGNSRNPACDAPSNPNVYCGVVDRYDNDCNDSVPGIQPCFHMELKKLNIGGVTQDQWVPVPGGIGTGYADGHLAIWSPTNDPGEGSPLQYTFNIHNGITPIGATDKPDNHIVTLVLVKLDTLR